MPFRITDQLKEQLRNAHFDVCQPDVYITDLSRPHHWELRKSPSLSMSVHWKQSAHLCFVGHELSHITTRIQFRSQCHVCTLTSDKCQVFPDAYSNHAKPTQTAEERVAR